jgi:translation elongation factor EF-Tu-like GTPase
LLLNTTDLIKGFLMTIESEIAALTTATTNLLGSVNVSKVTLDDKVTIATTQAVTATTQAGIATTGADTATTQAGIATAAAAKDIGQIVQSASYTLTLTDGGKHIYHPSSDTAGRTWTVPDNASVAFSIGTAITIVNATGAGLVTIAITSDTMYLSGSGETGSRLLEASGIATLLKVGPTLWIISGVGLS